MTLELYHRLADEASAAARRAVVDLGLDAKVRFRNVHFDEAAADLRAHGGAAIPALWDGARLHSGREAVLAALASLARTAER